MALRYLVRRHLGSGGIGSTWLVRDLLSDRDVALKLLHQRSPSALAALRREFSLLRGLVHPHLVRVHDLGTLALEASPSPFYTSDFVDGESLLAYARGRPFSAVAAALVGAVRGLAHLHRTGVRHGDVTPSNILVSRDGHATLIDLSCAVPLTAPPSDSVSGTPGYLAPEIMQGKGADARADVFSFGVTLVHTIEAASTKPPAAISRLAQQCVRQDPRDRPPSAAHLLDALGAPAYEPRALYLPPSSLVGRAASWASMRQSLDALVGGVAGPRCVVVSGPEGVGRTRLLQELKWEAQLRCPVVEASPRAALPVHDMLSRAQSGAPVEPHFRALLDATAALSKRDEPLVMIADDAHLLPEAAQQALLAVARSLDPRGRVMLVWSAIAPPSALPGDSAHIALEPLDEAAIREWAADILPPRFAPRLLRWTGGYPASLVALLSQMTAEAVGLHDLKAARGMNAWASRSEKAIASLPPAQRSVLAMVCVSEDPLTDDQASSMEVDLPSLTELTALGFIKHDVDGWRLTRTMDAPDLRVALGGQAMMAAHAAHASWLTTRLHALADDAEQVARLTPQRVWHLTMSGEIAAAAEQLRGGAHQAFRDPHGWRHAAMSLAEVSRDAGVLVLCAEVLTSAGRPDDALSVLDGIPAQGREGPRAGPAGLARAAAKLARGEAEEALHALDSLGGLQPGDTALHARAAIIRSRAHIHLGRALQAKQTAEQAYSDTLPSDVQGELLDAMGVAASYLGESREALRHLRAAASLHQQTGRPDALVRTLSYQAFHAYRAGETGVAERAYRDAREQIERHGFTDKLANAELNVGAACHQRGHWGEALACYERGMQIAAALGQVTHEVQARFNIAKLYADIGAADLADPMIERGQTLAEQAGQRFFASAFVALRAEVSAVRGEWENARSLFARAASEFTQAGALREAMEVRLQALEAMVALGAADQAAAELDTIDRSAPQPDAPDLLAALAVARARVRLAQGNARDATAALEEAVELARRADQPASRADIHRLFAQVWAHQRASTLSARELSLARELDERVAASLPEPLREPFWKHAKRRTPGGPQPSQLTAPALSDKLRRLLDINAKLNSSLRTRDVLSRTMDAAVELVGAERGFLILLEGPDRIDGRVTVPVARNLDREEVGKRHLKFSKTIAEQCMLTGEPIVTTDAQVDGRFATNASVHAMRLKSVVCVPIRSPSGTLGALYLDNRFQRGTFDAEDIDMLAAFGNQAAIALTNARLHDELRRRTRELEQERARVQELMDSQAAEIGRLTDQVRTTQQVLEHRYDYSNIVGRSRAMQQVFATLDRVIDSEVPVLILGESGTGKELIARALHVHGRRRNRPFVAINCAAVPHQLLESELFGHTKGAFTGAERDHDGLFVAAQGGTVLLDEIGDMPLDMQVKLLRVLQEGEVRPIGSSRAKRVDFRLACATHRDLDAAVAEGRFRQDLYYRIKVVALTLPALRERKEDIPELAHHFLDRHARKLGKPVPKLDREALQVLLRHRWPGNVRELENLLLQAVLLCDNDRVGAADVHPQPGRAEPQRLKSRRDYHAAEQEQIREALAASRWNVSLVARERGISRPTLYRKMRRYGIHEP